MRRDFHPYPDYQWRVLKAFLAGEMDPGEVIDQSTERASSRGRTCTPRGMLSIG